MTTKSAKWAFTALFAATLTACGGGGGSEEASLPPEELSPASPQASGSLIDTVAANAPRSINAELCETGLGEYCGSPMLASTALPSGSGTPVVCKIWTTGKVYMKDEQVVYQGATFKAKKVTHSVVGGLGGEPPPNNPTSWEKVSDNADCANPPKPVTAFEVKFAPPVGDQKAAGTCNAFATGYLITTLMNKLANRTELTEKSLPENIISARYLFTSIPDAQYPDRKYKEQCHGSTFDDIIQANKAKGTPSEKDAPYGTLGGLQWRLQKQFNEPLNATCLEAEIKKNPQWSKGLDRFQVTGHRTINVTDIESIKKELLLQNAVSFGTTLPYGFYEAGNNPAKYPILTQAVVDSLRAEGEAKGYTKQSIHAGGHAMLIVGFDDTKKAFKVQNSWGTRWGDKGYIWVSYEMWPSKDWTGSHAWWKSGWVVVKENPTTLQSLKDATKFAMELRQQSNVSVNPTDASAAAVGQRFNLADVQISLEDGELSIVPPSSSRSNEYNPDAAQYSETELYAAALRALLK